MQRRRFTGLAGALATVGTLSPRASWSADKKPITLGLITGLSGLAASSGNYMVLGAKIAADYVNKNGGVLGRTINIAVRDGKVNPAVATIASRDLNSNGINLQFGIISSTVALALSAIAKQENIAIMTCAAFSDKLTNEDFHQNYFRVTDDPYTRISFMTDVLCKKYKDVSHWSSVIPDQEFGRTTWAMFQNGMLTYYHRDTGKDVGFTKSIVTKYNSSDFRTAVTAAMQTPPGGFFMGIYGTDLISFYKQAQPYGFFKKVARLVDSASELSVPKAMKEDCPDMWTGAHWLKEAFTDIPLSNMLAEQVLKRTGDHNPEGFVSGAFSSVMAYVAAIRAAGSTDTDKVIDALEDVTFDTPTGPRKFRKEDHQAIKPELMYRVRGSSNDPKGWEIVEWIKRDGGKYIAPPMPGKALPIKTLVS